MTTQSFAANVDPTQSAQSFSSGSLLIPNVMRFAREDLDYLADVIARRTRVSDRMGVA
jgi:hypothetical protein